MARCMAVGKETHIERNPKIDCNDPTLLRIARPHDRWSEIVDVCDGRDASQRACVCCRVCVCTARLQGRHETSREETLSFGIVHISQLFFPFPFKSSFRVPFTWVSIGNVRTQVDRLVDETSRRIPADARIASTKHTRGGRRHGGSELVDHVAGRTGYVPKCGGKRWTDGGDARTDVVVGSLTTWRTRLCHDARVCRTRRRPRTTVRGVREHVGSDAGWNETIGSKPSGNGHRHVLRNGPRQRSQTLLFPHCHQERCVASGGHGTAHAKNMRGEQPNRSRKGRRSSQRADDAEE